jgi:phosphoribosyl-ATP pyrophosphohydrolase
MRVKHEVTRWHRKTFPNVKKSAMLAKIKEECQELIEAADSGITDDIMAELADLRIVSEAFFRFHKNTSLDSETMKKLAINRKRVWGEETPDGDRVRKK